MMKWEEINRRLKNGTSVKILAELDGVDYKTMYNRIRQHERKDGKTYMKESQMRAKRKPPKEEKKPWFLESSCETCLHRKESPETKKEYCAMGHKYEGPAGVCSEWSDPAPGKTVELPEASTAFDETPISELATCKYCKNISHRDNEPFCTMGHVYDGVNGTCSDWRADGKMAPADIPEVVPKLPEDIDNETIADVLKDINLSHADAVKMLHEHEEMLEQARKSERQLRTLLIAMEQLAKGRKLPED